MSRSYTPAVKDGVSRRFLLGAPILLARRSQSEATACRLFTFTTDVTPPLGSPLFNNVPATRIVDPLWARGFALQHRNENFVVVAVDWCEIRNDSYDRWRGALAEIAGTSPDRVLVTCVHQHDAPYTDRRAQELLAKHHVPAVLCDPTFEDQVISRVATSLREALQHPQAVSHVGVGMARVDQVASNRRFVRPDGKISFERTSATRDPAVRAEPAGLIDPWLRTLSFWGGERVLAMLSAYSTHPMSYYGQGQVSADFVGMARAQRQAAMPDALHIYTSGASGDTMAGKFNDGNPANRPILAARMRLAMEKAWRATRRFPLQSLRFSNARLVLEPRRSAGFSRTELLDKLADSHQTPRVRMDAALGLSWLERLDAGRAIDIPALELAGGRKRAQLLLLPAEAFVQYQLWAQQLRKDSFVVVMGYGECAPGYIPTALSAKEGYNDTYSWIAFPECEHAMVRAMRQALGSASD